ncbi:hypothetical protein TVAG_475540 [Trichomonas vaginalis G3]|uniref:Uncharacterized protein n=1 Tax=Trichomonas vaginalis (strain ATCC PRA-98 / G3) TaxID=412133 RepID=A2D9X8_TRIV3|nr:hypothetical protein TVAGG3_0265490 [Trichomonas vaginalis G3]EAY22626.1 hypothetical protein TVAG_475540 [Trichomonas vaginalis G3]KAI5525440.1 hypothetical protein TVAGG3_0265490 [Trichomonas vaginalis G3]|eukprot:XP_001583612.1 hypothetical protein [Trichomonas vaginalis G3]
MELSPARRNNMTNTSIVPSVEGPLKQTRLVLNNAILAAKDCFTPHRTKLGESQILIDNAIALQSSANRFNESIVNFNAKHNQKLYDQLVETNNALESTLSAFTDYSQAVNSTRSSTIKTVLLNAASYLPGIVYWLFESLKPEIKPIIKPEVVIDPLLSETWKIYQSLLSNSS